MVREITEAINQQIRGLDPRQEAYGIAQTFVKGAADKKVKFVPGVVDKDGEIKYVGIDDIFSLITYHKLLSCTTTVVASTGVGDKLNDLKNTYSMSLIAWWNMKKVNMIHDEMLMIFQARIPRMLKVNLLKGPAIIATTSSIMNSLQVFASEYREENVWLPEKMNLLQVNYTIETIFQPDCIPVCGPQT